LGGVSLKVRKTTWLVSFFLFALSLFILSQWAKETNSHSRFIHQNESHAEVFSVKKKDSILKNSITPLSSQANHKDFKSILVKKIQKRTSFQNQYQQAIHKLSQSIEEAGLDPNELNERYLNSLSKTAFLRQLPNEVAESYRKLFRKAHQLQQAILAEDGKPGNYFEEKQTKTQAPHWVQQRASQLKHMNLSGQLKDFVE